MLFQAVECAALGLDYVSRRARKKINSDRHLHESGWPVAR
jgi:hypothetical protein